MTDTGKRRAHKRGMRVALALMLSTSAAGLVAYQPVVAQSQDDYLRAFGNSSYTYCDAKLLGALWGMTPYEGKVEIGTKIVGGYDDNVPSVLELSRDRGNACEWADTGLAYRDAERLAAVWGIQPWDAKARAARMFTMGNAAEVLMLAQRDTGQSEEQSALERFWASGYGYCDARLIGELYGTDAYRGKIEIGNKIANGLVANIPIVLNESRERGARCNWTDLPYGYDDAVTLGQVWGMRTDAAKVAAEDLATWGRVDVIAAALGQEGH